MTASSANYLLSADFMCDCPVIWSPEDAFTLYILVKLNFTKIYRDLEEVHLREGCCTITGRTSSS
jgi:hypothetical protein